MPVIVWSILLIPTAVHSHQSVATLRHFNPKPPAAQMLSVSTSEDKKSTLLYKAALISSVLRTEVLLTTRFMGEAWLSCLIYNDENMTDH